MASAKKKSGKSDKKANKKVAKASSKTSSKSSTKPKAKAASTKSASSKKAPAAKKSVAKKPTPKAASKKSIAPEKPQKQQVAKKVAPTKVKAVDSVQENFEGADEQWVSLYKSHKSEKPVPYSMDGSFGIKTVIHHKVLGWGYVIKSKENRIDVVFRDGVKTLITNYKV